MTTPRPSTTARTSALYTGDIVHARRDVHARRAFRYPVFVAAIDLDELPALDRELRLFSHRRRNLFALYEQDYAAGTAPVREHHPAALRDAHTALLATHGMPRPVHARLVTNLRVLGYTFNPVSFFLGYDDAGALTSVVAEVNNTYGGRHSYVLGPAHRIDGTASDPGRAAFRVPRELFVSPFLHGRASYDIHVDAPLDGPTLAVTMHVTADEHDRRVFTAALRGRRRPLTDRALAGAALRYPLMSLQVIGLIHLEALKLRLLGAPYRRPDATHRPLVEPVEITTAPVTHAAK